MLLRMLLVVVTACLAGLLAYAGCLIWPLQLAKTTAMVAGVSVAISWALVLAVYLDSRKNSSK